MEDVVTAVDPSFRPVTRGCPCCAASAAQPILGSQPPAEAAGWEALAKSWAGFFQTKLFFTYHRCGSCGLLYCPTYFDEAQLGRLYGSMADNTAGLGADGTARTQQGYVDHLRHPVVDGDYLELGPDIGLFTQEFARRFDPQATRRYWLFEPNVAVHDELRRRMSGQRAEVRTTLLNMDEIPPQSLGAAVMIHVLDHLIDPRSVLRTLREKMRPGASLYVVTHNERSWLARALGRRWPAYCLQHPQLFEPKTMAALARQAGFEVTAVRRTTNYFPMAYLARHGLYAVGLNWPAIGRVRGPAIGLKLGNMMTIARAS